MTHHRVQRNKRPMDSYADLQPMSYEDEAFWHRNDPPRPSLWRRLKGIFSK